MAQPPAETSLEPSPLGMALIRIAGTLMSQGPMKGTILSVLDLVAARLRPENHTHVWVGLDGISYGEVPDEVVFSPRWEREIKVGNHSRGRLCARPSTDNGSAWRNRNFSGRWQP